MIYEYIDKRENLTLKEKIIFFLVGFLAVMITFVFAMFGIVFLNYIA